MLLHETIGYEAQRRIRNLPLPFAVVFLVKRGRYLFIFQKAGGEGGRAFKAHFIACIGDGHILLQQYFRAVHPHLDEVTVRRIPVNGFEQADEMEFGKAGLFRDIIKVNALMEMCVDKQL